MYPTINHARKEERALLEVWARHDRDPRPAGWGRLPARHPVACQGTMTEDSRGTWMKEEKERLSLPLFSVSLFYPYSEESFVRAKLRVDKQRLKGQLSSVDSPSPSPLMSAVYNPHPTPSASPLF